MLHVSEVSIHSGGVEMLVDRVPRESRGNSQNTGSLGRP